MAKKKEDKLKKDYESKKVSAGRFCTELVEQIKELTHQNNIYLAVPIESRVKTWSSISSKIERRNLKLKDIIQLNDLVGIRLILLFKRDLIKSRELIEENLEIIEQEDTASRLGESQFGYQSYHYVIKLPNEWLSIPTFKDFAEYKSEIQIRTIAQHIWAAASHYLQYKQEDNVPRAVRRSIYRVSAFLETVDLEFERVLSERENYIKELKPEIKDETLNVDILKEILDSHLPSANRSKDEDYSDLLGFLSFCKIDKSSQLISLIKEQLQASLEEDAKMVTKIKKVGLSNVSETFKVRTEKGVYYTHTGLIRDMLDDKFGIKRRMFGKK
jgi:ppGpp synthetase/RelA/SpoT-type nucleotidyltranferase